MALVKLPDGQMVNKDLIESVQGINSEYANYVEINLKGAKAVSISCNDEKEVMEMLEKVSEALGL